MYHGIRTCSSCLDPRVSPLDLCRTGDGLLFSPGTNATHGSIKRTQLAGAYYGASGIPSEWRTKIALRGLVESMAEELYEMSNRVDADPDAAAPADSQATSGTLPRPTVTRFEVKPRTKGASRDYGGAYWEGGVAAHYRMLEDGYM